MAMDIGEGERKKDDRVRSGVDMEREDVERLKELLRLNLNKNKLYYYLRI